MRDEFDAIVADEFTVLDGVAVPDIWSRVQLKTLDHLSDRYVEEEATMIDLATPSHARNPQKPNRRVLVAGLLAAAAVVAIVVVARDDEPRPGQQPSPTVSLPGDEMPALTVDFVSPRNGFSIKHPDGVEVVPATQQWEFTARPDDAFDVVETGGAAVFKGVSMEIPYGSIAFEQLSLDQWFDQDVAADDRLTPDGCGEPRDLQAEIRVDGWPGRISECANLVEATVVARGRLYLFALTHEGSDGRAVFDAFAATIDITPETAVNFPDPTTTFVSPTYGYSFDYTRGEPTPATERWDPANQATDVKPYEAFDAVETGMGAFLEAASVVVPEGVSIDEWVDEYVSPTGCAARRARQAEITIDGQPGRLVECPNQIQATVVADGRLYLFTLLHSRDDARAFFETWIATIDLTPRTATVP